MKGCFIGNAGMLLLICHARKRCYKNESQQRGRKYIGMHTANFFSVKCASNCFSVVGPEQVNIAVGLFGASCLQGRTSFLKFAGKLC